MKTLAHHGRPAVRHDDRDGASVATALLVIVALLATIWGAWRLGVMAGDQVDWRQHLPTRALALRRSPDPQPIPIPTPRRPGIEAPAAQP